MSYLGDISVGGATTHWFATVDGARAPATITGAAIVCYRANSTVETTAGLTLTVDVDSRTGLHRISIDTSADGAFYISGFDYAVVASAGTVDGVSLANRTLCTFSIANRRGVQQADIQSAMTAQGYTTARAGMLSNLGPQMYRASPTRLQEGTLSAPSGTVIELATSEVTSDVYLGCVVVLAKAGETPLIRRVVNYTQSGGPTGKDTLTLDATIGALTGAWRFAVIDSGAAAAPTSADNAAAVRTELATELARLDAAVSSRATPADLSVTVTPTVVSPAATTSVTQPPLTTLGPDRPRNLSVYQNAAAVFPFNAVDADGETIDLTGKTLCFVIHDANGNVAFVRETGDGVTYADGTVSVAITETETADVMDGLYKLWNKTDRQVLGAGRFVIRLAPIDEPE